MSYLLCNCCGRRTAESDFADFAVQITASVAIEGRERRELVFERKEFRVCTDCRNTDWKVYSIEISRSDNNVTPGRVNFRGED